MNDMIDDMHCLICDEFFAEDEIDDHLLEEHLELLEDFDMVVDLGRVCIDALELPFVELY